MKIDMPNPHAIYLHDTPSRNLFNAKVRAFSHGCIRTEKAVELGMVMAMLGAGLTPADAIAKSTSGKYNKVPMTRTFPVYINYITYGRDLTGQLTAFTDIYGRDAPVIASFQAPRQLKTTQRSSNEAIIKLDNPL
jgi:murein L,D-transpeptidase YcbB/YkuD